MVKANIRHSCRDSVAIDGKDKVEFAFTIQGTDTWYRFAPKRGPVVVFSTRDGVESAVSPHDRKDGGFIRQFTSNASLHFTRDQFFARHSHFQRVHSTAAGLLPTALYTTEQEGQRETTPLPLSGRCTHKSSHVESCRTHISLMIVPTSCCRFRRKTPTV